MGLSVLLFVSSLSVVPVEALRVALGVPFVLFLPGYALQAAFLPRTGGLDGVERAALSFGLSLALVPLVGLALHFSPWGIRPTPIVAALASLTLVMAGVAYLRRRLASSQNRAAGSSVPGLQPLLRWWMTGGPGDKAFAAAVIVVVIGVWGGLIYAVSRPPPSEAFTEFYILGPTGKTEGYPSQLRAGTPAELRVGMVNRERRPGTYHAELYLGEEKVGETLPQALQAGEKWEGAVTLVPKHVSDKQKLQVLLYKEPATQPESELYLWVTVHPAD